MNRQAILERLGWKFARIRGSAFYRDPDLAMKSVFNLLNELEILPNTSNNSQSILEETNLIDDLRTIISNGFVSDPFEIISDGDDLTGVSVNIDSVDFINSFENSSIINNQLEPSDGSLIESNSQVHDAGPAKNSEIFNNDLGLINYSQYAGKACTDPRICNQDNISDGLVNIISVEGPVQVKRVFDIYLRSCGIKRMGHDIRAIMLLALESLNKKNIICGHNYRDPEDKLVEIVWLKGNPSEIIRRRGDRSLEEIPLGELYAISELVAKNMQLPIGSEEHLRAMLEYLDLKRLTSLAESILKQAIAGEFQPILI